MAADPIICKAFYSTAKSYSYCMQQNYWHKWLKAPSVLQHLPGTTPEQDKWCRGQFGKVWGGSEWGLVEPEVVWGGGRGRTLVANLDPIFLSCCKCIPGVSLDLCKQNSWHRSGETHWWPAIGDTRLNSPRLPVDSHRSMCCAW